ncbi:hypothetical protein [Larkinella terrae]|uniref:Uncharacterized protein n=1 Tax=Larkinella terrae TaxID=2025311 RepID=A0A7K0EIU2_9BACT|nr:hypothetical protein [Larkinella terrae]MRS61763.1 hypothetical protein [Larkinella terrae]
MKLYCYRPGGHGQWSFFVVASSEEEAFAKVQAEVDCLRSEMHNYECQGWDTDYYSLEILEPGEVATNEND